MPASDSAAFPHPPDPGAEDLVHFSFPIRWGFLSKDPAVPPAKPHADPKPPRMIFTASAEPDVESAALARRTAGTLAEAAVATPPGSAGSASGDHSGPADRWGMVVPKMSRPAARPSKRLIAESPVAPAATVGPAQPPRPVSAPPERVAADSVAAGRRIGEGFLAAQPVTVPRSVLRGIPPPLLMGASAAGVPLAAAMLLFTPRTAALPMVPAPMVAKPGPAIPAGQADWLPLAAWPRRISVVRGSTDLGDFRMEFRGRITGKALGWVFRARDAKNFYASKLELVHPGPTASVVLKRFAVIDGRDQPAAQIPLRNDVAPGTIYKIRTEGSGDKFTTWVSDRKVDEWTDARLPAGAVGFFHDPGESGTITSEFALFRVPRN